MNKSLWFDVGTEEDAWDAQGQALHYVNAYWKDAAGSTRRETVAECLPWKLAQQLAQALEAAREHLLIFPDNEKGGS